MDSMGCIVGIEVATGAQRLVEPKWLRVPSIDFGELPVAGLRLLVIAGPRQLAADSFEQLAIGKFRQLAAIELERLAFDIVGFAELIEPKLEKLNTARAVLDTEHIIEHKHSMDTIKHTAEHIAVTNEHFATDTERTARHITVVRRITARTITTSFRHKPTTIMAEELARQQQEFVAVGHRTIVGTIIAVASAFGIAIDSTVAIAERMEIGID